MRTLVIAAITICLFVGSVYGQEAQSLKLQGVDITKYGNATIIVIGVTNVSHSRVKAFRAALFKSNDFNESEKVLSLEYSSESGFRTADGRSSSHIIKPGETVFYFIRSGTDGSGETFYTDNVGKYKPTTSGPFTLKVAKTVSDD